MINLNIYNDCNSRIEGLTARFCETDLAESREFCYLNASGHIDISQGGKVRDFFLNDPDKIYGVVEGSIKAFSKSYKLDWKRCAVIFKNIVFLQRDILSQDRSQMNFPGRGYDVNFTIAAAHSLGIQILGVTEYDRQMAQNLTRKPFVPPVTGFEEMMGALRGRRSAGNGMEETGRLETLQEALTRTSKKEGELNKLRKLRKEAAALSKLASEMGFRFGCAGIDAQSEIQALQRTIREMKELGLTLPVKPQELEPSKDDQLKIKVIKQIDAFNQFFNKQKELDESLEERVRAAQTKQAAKAEAEAEQKERQAAKAEAEESDTAAAIAAVLRATAKEKEKEKEKMAANKARAEAEEKAKQAAKAEAEKRDMAAAIAAVERATAKEKEKEQMAANRAKAEAEAKSAAAVSGNDKDSFDEADSDAVLDFLHDDPASSTAKNEPRKDEAQKKPQGKEINGTGNSQRQERTDEDLLAEGMFD